MPERPRHWKVLAGTELVDSAVGRERAMELARWWRHRRRVAVYHQLTGERWELRAGSWIKVTPANAGAEEAG